MLPTREGRLRKRLSLWQASALQLRAARINRIVPLLDPTHNSLLVQDVGGAQGDAPFLVQDSIIRAHGLPEIAEQGERQAEVFGKALVAGSGIYTDSKDLRVVLTEVSDISLIRFEFGRSARRECQHIKGQHHIFLAAKVAELDLLAGVIG